VIDYGEALDLQDGIPGGIRDELFECPETGSGERRVFRWIFYMVNRLLPYCSPNEILELLQAACAECGRDTDSDIRGAITTASGHQPYSSGRDIHSSNAVRKRSKAPFVDYGRVVELYREHGGYDSLLKFCGTTPELKATKTLDWLYDLYRPDDVLCLGPRKEFTIIAPLASWGCLIEENSSGLGEHCCFLTPNPFKPDAEQRCNAGILERRYFVSECDIVGTRKGKDETVVETPWYPILEKTNCTGWDLQAGIILHLFELGYPIASIVHSGNKSLHVWCSARSLTEDQVLQMIDYAASLGADDAGKTVSQFMRLPNPNHATRKQHLIYHNPTFINK
jgi:hypothetical protein